MHKTMSELARRWLPHRAGELSLAENRVLQSAIEGSTISRDVNRVHDTSLSRGDRIADAIARIGGSWPFILGFVAFLVIWTVGGPLLLSGRDFDPYPFIFLNLVLSMIAALQAPVIMMSQNRQSQHDRIDAAHDYEVNLKAEIEILALHEKLDELRHRDILTMRDEIVALRGIVERMEAVIAASPAR